MKRLKTAHWTNSLTILHKSIRPNISQRITCLPMELLCKLMKMNKTQSSIKMIGKASKALRLPFLNFKFTYQALIMLRAPVSPSTSTIKYLEANLNKILPNQPSLSAFSLNHPVQTEHRLSLDPKLKTFNKKQLRYKSTNIVNKNSWNNKIASKIFKKIKNWPISLLMIK